MSSVPVLTVEETGSRDGDATMLAGLLGLQERLLRETPATGIPMPPLSNDELKAFHLLRRDVPESYLAQFRQLRGRLAHRREEEERQQREMRSLLITSPARAEGKTFASLNLALMLSVAPGARVLWADLHARRPAFPQSPHSGFSRGILDCLAGLPWSHAVRQVPHMELYLMSTSGAGHSLRDAFEYHGLREWLREQSRAFEWIVLDGPALNDGPDAELLAHAADATLLVVRPGVTQFERLDYLLDRLDRSRVAGIIFNGAA